ncbi:MAG: indolepyruvate ferredoxin oxidoreductase [Deltaproteobacteria bacterium CG_4_8_14_3_um_filter_51_11]|nr:indolepyruvate ferredoxin oxidoreductase subunit alpha [bacterium]OIP42975.1 MAG: indolepyruvate ferredoxin oxidoreductase [Desulfobacteraceae bacterium CG2_30_51_40]PIP46568.1 MAG: indolepyruvate ferredoxin oxidoreductase [Deltaproteobacteria bacterium CG23_combo_of_CG06-09_8_20_14_all_51_20]PIX18510.1 MAG: indolepyruvate ferredoxin oxidoreductase [Deltaproteobacteria bacterium CG_4_8_14_3_um_filter_51_11]PIY22394.1 MAG: indolepyruvate ferredoxin oxidoreductase [Deltaproteobacteria bacteriu
MNELFEIKGGDERLLQGNEAIARGALEAGVRFCAGYPGNPSSEILETLAEAAKELPIYAEWSINEKVALEAAAAASFAGLRAIVSMKQNGVNVVSDFLTNLTLSGTGGGLVLVTCDDPGGISSTNEEDARLFAKLSDVPLLEPATPQEALEMTKWAFELSERIKNIVILRSVSRLSHTRANVLLGSIPPYENRAFFDTKSPFHTFPVLTKHLGRHRKLDEAMAHYEGSSFSRYDGPERAEMLVISSGSSWNYAAEAVEILGLTERIGVLKLGMTWPLPVNILRRYLKYSERIFFVEELDPFVEEGVKALCAELASEVGIKEFYGRSSGHIPICGELSPSVILGVLGDIFSISWRAEEYRARMKSLLPQPSPPREFGFCPGCPHRGTYYAIKEALAWDGRNGFVSGDIGCYSMGIWPTGFSQVKSVHAMGSGVGLASGYGKLGQFGFDQPVITVCGDSTFFHAAITALINARFNNSDILLLVLDNSATAMTGFQPHPGTGSTAMGEKVEPVDIETVCRSLGVGVEVGDPYDMEHTAETIYRLMQEAGQRVLILKRKCALVQGRQGGFPYTMRVDQQKCLGEDCGCGRYCTRIFRCPGLIWDSSVKKARIDEVICVGCGICASACPSEAIIRQQKAPN